MYLSSGPYQQQKWLSLVQVYKISKSSGSFYVPLQWPSVQAYPRLSLNAYRKNVISSSKFIIHDSHSKIIAPYICYDFLNWYTYFYFIYILP